MPELLKNFRGTIDWSDLSKTVQKCADEAMNKRKADSIERSGVTLHMIVHIVFLISLHQESRLNPQYH